MANRQRATEGKGSGSGGGIDGSDVDVDCRGTCDGCGSGGGEAPKDRGDCGIVCCLGGFEANRGRMKDKRGRRKEGKGES